MFVVGIDANRLVYSPMTTSSLNDLGAALRLLTEYHAWTDDNTISVIDEIVGTYYWKAVTYCHCGKEGMSK